jgi:hypothetical protein
MPKGVKAEYASDFIDEVIADEDPTLLRTLYKKTEVADGEYRLFVKISKVIDADEETDEWLLRVTQKMRDAGSENVAWRVTKISPEDYDPENTTESFPIDLFQSYLETEVTTISLPQAPMEPFGSDAFWERFDSDTK